MKALIYSLIVLFPMIAQSQQIIKGKIKSGREPLPGVNVFVKGSYDGCSSQGNGEYELRTNESGKVVLIFSFIGYKNLEKEIQLNFGQTLSLDVELVEQANELNTVNIIAGSFESGASMKKATVLSSLDVATTAGSQADIYSAMQTLPGTQPQGNEEGLFIRGGAAYENKTIFDGTFVQKPFMNNMPGIAQRGRFGPFAFKGMSFNTGGYSAQYGQALSGLMVLESKDMPDKNTTDFGIMSVGLSAGHTQVFKNSSLQLSGSAYNLALVNRLIPQNIDWERDPRSEQLNLNFRQKITKNGLLKVYSEYVQNQASFWFDNPENAWKSNKLDNQDRSSYSNISYQDYIHPDWKINVGLGVNIQRNQVQLDTAEIQRNDDFVHGRLMIQGNLNTLTQIRFGIDHVLQSKEEKFNQAARDFNEGLSASFVELDYYITHRWMVRVGLRAEQSKLLVQQNLAPRISMGYKHNKYHDLNVAFGKFYQSPQDQYLIQNNRLTFEQSQHYLFSYQFQKAEYLLRAELYRKNYDQLVNISGVNLMNEGYGYAQGFDLFWRDKKNIRRGDYWISYSFVDSKRVYDQYSQLVQPSYVSSHVLNVVYKEYLPKIQTQIGVTYTFASGRPFERIGEVGQLNGRSKSIHNLSANASYVTSIRDHFTVLHVSVGNVAGIKNVFGYQTGSDGTQRAVEPNANRTVFIGLFISIGDDNVLN